MTKSRVRFIQALLCACALWSAPTQAQMWISVDDDSMGSAITTEAPNLTRPGGQGFALSGSSSALSGSMTNVAVSTAAGDQNFPAGISDGAGGMIIVWEDPRNAAVSGRDIYAHHVLACGKLDPSWPVGGVALTQAPGDDRFPVISKDGAGGAFVVWNEEQNVAVNADVFAQHLLANGTVDPGWPANGLGVCTAPGSQSLPKITFDGANGAFVTWADNRASLRVFVHHLLASGVDPGWTVNGIPVCPTVAQTQTRPVICSDGAGGAIVAWIDSRSLAFTGRDIYAQRMSAAGALLWAPAGAPVTTAPQQQVLNGATPIGFVWILTSSDEQSNAIVPDGAGGCLLTWVDSRAFNNDVYAQRLTAAGSVAAGWPANGVPLCTDPGDQNGPSLVPDGSGGAIGTWNEDTRPAPFAQHVSGAGIVTGPFNGLALSGAGPANFVPLGVSDGAGGAIFFWSDSRNVATSDLDAYAHHVVTAPGFALDPAWPVDGSAVSTALGAQFFGGGGSAVSDGVGGAVAAWVDFRDFATTRSDIYAQGLLASGSLGSLSVDPVAMITGPASGSVFPINTAVTFTGSFTDTDPDVHTAQWQFDALPPVAGTVNEAAHTVSVNYTFTTPGVYLVKLTVTDQCGGTSTSTQVGGFDAMVVIYDPNAGFVTGGGWINSPAGAYVPEPSLIGKANFGFVAKYQKGATVPTGNTEFQFKTAALNFSSTSYEWLVVAGAKAQYKGAGTINGAGDYRFMLTAIDGNLLGNQADKFRMKITDASNDALIYDNQLNAPDDSDPTTVLGGGTVVIHKPNGGGPSGGSAQGAYLEPTPTDFALSRGEPNPFKLSTLLRYGLPERSRVEIDLHDVSGRRMQSLVHGEMAAGAHELRLSDRDPAGNPLGAGIYFLRMSARSLHAGTRFSATRKLVVIP